jgi:hypothetical protein
MAQADQERRHDPLAASGQMAGFPPADYDDLNHASRMPTVTSRRQHWPRMSERFPVRGATAPARESAAGRRSPGRSRLAATPTQQLGRPGGGWDYGTAASTRSKANFIDTLARPTRVGQTGRCRVHRLVQRSSVALSTQLPKPRRHQNHHHENAKRIA